MNRENIDKGIFAVNSDEDDIFDFCFTSYLQAAHQMPQPREIHIEIKHGIEAKNYDQVASISKLKPLELELQKLEDLSASIVADFAMTCRNLTHQPACSETKTPFSPHIRTAWSTYTEG